MFRLRYFKDENVIRNTPNPYKSFPILGISIPVVLFWACFGVGTHLIEKAFTQTEAPTKLDTIASSCSVVAGFRFQYAPMDLSMDLQYTLEDYTARLCVCHKDQLLEISSRAPGVRLVKTEVPTLENPWSVYPFVGYCRIELASEKEITITSRSIKIDKWPDF